MEELLSTLTNKMDWRIHGKLESLGLCACYRKSPVPRQVVLFQRGLILQAMENGPNILSKGFWLLPMVKAVIIKKQSTFTQ